MKVLIDNGHGINTPGKQSPDGRLKEYAYTRLIASTLETALRAKGIDAERFVTEQNDIPLSVRCKRVNDICRKLGAKNVLLVSIHNNAAGGDGKWYSARGFSAHVALNASSKSKIFAQYLWNAAIAHHLQGNRSIPQPPYIAQNLAICRDTLCAAVLTENLFQDNKDDVEFLLSETGKNEVVQTHVDGIMEFVSDYSV